jgi:uncharacterized protein YdhG (YjbR/CyaY superfamily)
MMAGKESPIDIYIRKVPEHAQKHSQEMRAILKKVAPKADEVVKWRMPMFEEGRILFAFGTFKDHINLIPTPAAMKPFMAELKKYKTGKGSISFPYDTPLPKSLITKIAKYRLKDVRENDARWM